MQPHAVDGRMRRARSPAGFSLAEMMIALAILGMGLLVIGAALPIGIRYTRASVNKATGEAAAEYALDVIEQNVCLRTEILDPNNGALKCEPGVFQPRNAVGRALHDYEPVIKVRPLHVRAIDGNPASQFYGRQSGAGALAPTEQSIRFWLPLGVDTREADADSSLGYPTGPWMRWALPSVATVYPPISSDAPFTAESFITGNMYLRRPVTEPPNGSETLKALDRRIVWTAFYRRVSYEAGSDPALYEFIVVALRVPGDGYRFPVQAPNDGGGSDDGDEGPGTTGGNGENGEMTVTGMGSLGPSGGYGSASAGASSGGRPGGDGNSVGGASGIETAAPIPWLVSFRSLPSPPNQATPFDANGYPLDAQGYAITMGGANAPATLKFTCRPDRSGLFPVGSIFIPARNDNDPNLLQGSNEPRVGFGPPAPAALPVYEVAERPDEYTVIVKFNGFFPMRLNPVNGRRDTPDGVQWPVWVIPPAFAEYEGTPPNQQPTAPDQCQIVAVARRYMRLREVP